MSKILTSTFAALLAACTASGTTDVRYSATATASAPQFVEVEPEVQVIADYHEPVFYTDQTYWLFRGGVWYRSNDYRSGWVRIDAPPPRLRTIQRPERYVRYRG